MTILDVDSRPNDPIKQTSTKMTPADKNHGVHACLCMHACLFVHACLHICMHTAMQSGSGNNFMPDIVKGVFKNGCSRAGRIDERVEKVDDFLKLFGLHVYETSPGQINSPPLLHVSINQDCSRAECSHECAERCMDARAYIHALSRMCLHVRESACM